MNLYNPFKREAYMTSFKEDFQRKKYSKRMLAEEAEKVESIYYNAKRCIFVIKKEEMRKKASRFNSSPKR